MNQVQSYAWFANIVGGALVQRLWLRRPQNVLRRSVMHHRCRAD